LPVLQDCGQRQLRKIKQQQLLLKPM